MSALRPTEVHNRLRKHMLVDGLDLVFDLDRSEGVTIQDCRDGRQYLDFFSFFATNPIGINHPKLRDKEFKEFLSEVAGDLDRLLTLKVDHSLNLRLVDASEMARLSGRQWRPSRTLRSSSTAPSWTSARSTVRKEVPTRRRR